MEAGRGGLVLFWPGFGLGLPLVVLIPGLLVHSRIASAMHNPKEPNETTYFCYIRTLDGRLEPIDVVRQNGRSVPRFSPGMLGGHQQESPSDLLPLYREVTYGLSRLERRTWLPLLFGRSVEEVAQVQGVTRAAIYARIRGNSKGQGGMIRKNDYVAIWWRTQRKRLFPSHA